MGGDGIRTAERPGPRAQYSQADIDRRPLSQRSAEPAGIESSRRYQPHNGPPERLLKTGSLLRERQTGRLLRQAMAPACGKALSRRPGSTPDRRARAMTARVCGLARSRCTLEDLSSYEAQTATLTANGSLCGDIGRTARSGTHSPREGVFDEIRKDSVSPVFDAGNGSNARAGTDDH